VSRQPIVRIRWQVVTCYEADVPAKDARAAGVAEGPADGKVERWLDGLRERHEAREVGEDGGTIVEVENLGPPRGAEIVQNAPGHAGIPGDGPWAVSGDRGAAQGTMTAGRA